MIHCKELIENPSLEWVIFVIFQNLTSEKGYFAPSVDLFIYILGEMIAFHWEVNPYI